LEYVAEKIKSFFNSNKKSKSKGEDQFVNA
jgi:hypothetical protein